MEFLVGIHSDKVTMTDLGWQAALAEKAILASGSSSQASEDTISDIGTDVDTPRRVGTPRGVRRERDLPPPGQREKYNEQVRNLENQVCFMDAPYMLVHTQNNAICIGHYVHLFHMLTCACLWCLLYKITLLVEVSVFFLCRSSFHFGLSHMSVEGLECPFWIEPYELLWRFIFDTFQVKELRNELRVKTEELRNKEERVKNLTREKQLLEQKVSRLERNKTEEV